MIARLLGACIRRRALLSIAALLLVAFGAYSYENLVIEAYPELGSIVVVVTTQANGLAAEEVEQQITVPLERQLSGTANLVSMRSSSTFGLSLITLTFNDRQDLYFARQRTLERIAAANLPSTYQPALNPLNGPVGEIYRYTLVSESKNLMELSELQRWVVIPALQSVHGVTNVDNFGGFTKEFRLDLDLKEMQRFGIALSDVTAAINANTASAGGSRTDRGEQSFVVRGIGLVHSLDDLGAIVVANRNGVPILLRDLGRLSYGHQERQGILGRNNNPDAVQGVVDMLRGENASLVLKAVHAKVDELNRKLAAQDVAIVPYIDRDELVTATIDKVGHTVMEGVALVFVVLILFLGSPRSAVVVAVTIPAALIAVFALMNAFHMPANLFSLGALDFGIIVDGAIVVTEALLRLREENSDRELTEEDVRDTAAQVARPIFFATLIIMAAYLPLLSFEHAEAKLFAPMALTVAFALSGALLCTLTLIPGLAFWAFRRPRRVFRNRPLEWLERGYERALALFLRVPALATLAAVVSLVAVGVLGGQVGREFLPDLDEGSLWLQVQLPTGLSLTKASEMASELRRTIRAFPEVSYVVTQLGRSDDATDPWTPSHIEAPVGLKPYSTWPVGETKAQFVEKLRLRLKQLPGFDVGISQPISDNVNDEVGGAHSALAILIYGDDFHELRNIAGQIVTVLKGIRGTGEASIFQEPPIPQLVVKADRAAAARFGINVQDIMNLVQTGIGGAAVTQVYVKDRQYNVTVRFPESERRNADAIGRLVLNSSTGAQIPLSEVATIKLASGESSISHQGTERNLTVRIDLHDRDLGSYLEEATRAIDEKVHYDHNLYHISFAGQFENQRRAQARLTIVLGVVMAIMLVLLYVGLGSLRQAVLTLGVVPLAALGGLLALLLRHETLNVASAVGFIALFGVAVQNGIIMVANLNRLRDEGTPLREAVIGGAAERFRPVLMTATVATLGMLPAAMAIGVGTDVQRAVATVVVGGLLFATLLTLFILPTFYFVLERFVERRQARAAAAALTRRTALP